SSKPKVQPTDSSAAATVASQAAQHMHGASNGDAAGELSESRANNSIAAVRAALSDAKCKFFGINSHEYAAVPPPTAAPPSATHPSETDASAAVAAVVQPEASGLLSVCTTPERVLPYGTTYEQIPLSDLDIPQPSQVQNTRKPPTRKFTYSLLPQAVYMSTTVPQNIKGMKIAGRHTPTRNSLRHSRMIVVNNKTRHSIQDSYSAHVRTLNLSRQLLIFQLAIGLLIVCLSVWILILAPHASMLINPYLSGLSLLLASIAGLILLGRSRRADYQRSYHNCRKVLLAESYVFCTLALIFCSLALVCAAIEFAEVASSLASVDGACGPATSSLLNYRNCSCATETPNEATTASTSGEIESDSVGANCQAIGGEWKYILGCSMALNAAGIVATFLYIMIYICCYRSSRKHFNTSI
ncbi:hypothetical protein KR093_001957, partial [Drosophila rubida]